MNIFQYLKSKMSLSNWLSKESNPRDLRQEMTDTMNHFTNLFHQMDRFMPPVVSDMVPRNETKTDEQGNELVLRSGLFNVVADNEKELKLHVDMPGVDKENLKVQLNNKTLQWSAHRVTEKESEDGSKSSSTFDYSGSYLLPFVPKGVSANMKDGLLYLTVTKPDVEPTTTYDINVE